MVLDTRWKKFKYSNGSKLLCVVLALVMAATFVLNGLALILCSEFFDEEDFLKSENRSFFGSYVFALNINRDISTIVEQVNYNEELKQFAQAQAEYVETAMKNYRAEEAKNRLSDEDIAKYIERLHNDEGIYNAEQGYYYNDDYNDKAYLNTYYNIYTGYDGYWYKTDFDFDELTTASYVSGSHMNFGHNDERAKAMLTEHFRNHHYDDYVSLDYYYRDIGTLENIRYYGENNDGTVFTNVEDSTALINSIKLGEGDYIALENGSVTLSQSLEELRDSLWTTGKSNCRIYISVNTAFDGEDRYGVIFKEYSKVENVDVSKAVTAMAISLIAMIALLVISVRLAGHTENGISLSFIDKFPHDLHLAITGTLVFLSGAGIYALLEAYMSIMPYSSYNYFVERAFFSSVLFRAAIAALACAIYLLILEFASSIARSVKAERPIIKNTAIARIFILIFKLIFKHGGKGLIIVLKFIFVTVIGGFFKLIWKVIRKFLHLIKLLALKPKRLEKKLVSATVLYTLFNFVSIGVIVLLFAAYDPFFDFCGFLGIIVFLGLDAYAVYRAMKYLKALDDIIDTSAKREPLPYDTNTLPLSLKTLAESLEATNAELQEAVLKAVKDERTKAELITNVSHDLKTPLTSVINYIDLLQKCDIEDETAKQYMAVIEEKSARLKRLIEDLIEASKVSTGNVTLNKTKLNLCELASQAIVEETSNIEQNNLQIIFEETSNKHIVYADGTKIYRVFENLLSNARKYSAPYTRIYASVYSDDNAGYFEIKNISKDPLNISAEELTERFVRGDKSRSEEGNGLGLSIARELCKLNGGDLIITIDGDLFKATVKLPKEEI